MIHGIDKNVVHGAFVSDLLHVKRAVGSVHGIVMHLLLFGFFVIGQDIFPRPAFRASLFPRSKVHGYTAHVDHAVDGAGSA